MFENIYELNPLYNTNNYPNHILNKHRFNKPDSMILNTLYNYLIKIQLLKKK